MTTSPSSIKVVEFAGIRFGFWNRWDVSKHVRMAEILVQKGELPKHELQRMLGLNSRRELDGLIAEINVLALELGQQRAIVETDDSGALLMLRSAGRQVQAVRWNHRLGGKVYLL